MRFQPLLIFFERLLANMTFNDVLTEGKWTSNKIESLEKQYHQDRSSLLVLDQHINSRNVAVAKSKCERDILVLRQKVPMVKHSVPVRPTSLERWQVHLLMVFYILHHNKEIISLCILVDFILFYVIKCEG